MSGDGGDERFTGYGWYFGAANHWRKVGAVQIPVRSLTAHGLTMLSPGTWTALYRCVAPALPERLRRRKPGDKPHKLAEILTVESLEVLYLAIVSHWKSDLGRPGLHSAGFVLQKPKVFIGSRHMLPTARELFLNGNPGLAENTAARDLLEEKFFCSIYLSNGTHKRTWAGRLDDVDKISIAAFQKLGVVPKTFLDVAVSSGVSTAMWLDSLRQAGVRPSMTATDLTMTAYLVRVNSWLHVLVDKEGFPLQYDVFGLVWRPRCRIRFYALGNGVLTVLWHLLYLKAAKRFSLMTRLKSLGTNSPPTDAPLIKAQIKLVTHRLRDNRDIELLDDDIMAATPDHLRRRFEMIRAANILNRSYFSVQQLCAAVRNLRDRLIGPGALLLIVRTDETDSNHGSIFCLDANGSFGVLERVGRGSDIEDIVLST